MLRARLRLIHWLIVRAVPLLNQFRKTTSWSLTVSELNQFRPGSWGRVLAQFLTVRRLGFLPQYEAHDALHCLLGYGTTATGELRLQAFMMGNRSTTVAGRVLLLIGFCLLPELHSRLRDEFQRGRASARVASLSIIALLGEPIQSIRCGIREAAV
jgi:hypothetical protein